MECHVSSIFLASFGGHGIRPTRIQARMLGVWQKSLNILNCEILRAAMVIARKIEHVSLVICTNDWHNRRSSMKLNWYIPPPIASVHLAVNSTALTISETHQFEIEVLLERKMC